MSELSLWLSLVAILSPLFASAVVFVWTWGREDAGEALTTSVVRGAFIVGLAAATALFVQSWFEPVVTVSVGTWFEAGGHPFHLGFLLDKLSTAMMVLTLGACALIGHFSKTYLHAEPGFARFFFLLSVFAVGMLILVMAGSLDFMFVGWELVGLTSALLIAYFHERNAPVQNGLRAFITYRICDVGLLVGIILLHHFAAVSDFRSELGAGHWSAGTAHLDGWHATLIGTLLLIGAMGKSAQLPVGGWLPRAMEGPTPSSAIFYGALSVHAGVYLLLRIQPLLEDSAIASYLVVGVGLFTAVLATLSGRVQTDIKNGLAYATMTQVGIMFVEVGLHLPTLATIHLIGHACLRTWQLLRSPAILHELHTIRGGLDSDFETGSLLDTLERKLPGPIGAFLFQRALDRFYFDALIDRFVAGPIMRLGRAIAAFDDRLSGGSEPEPSPPRRAIREARNDA